MYDCGRFFTITGNRHPDATAEINDRSEGIASVYDEIKTKKPKTTKPKSQSTANQGPKVGRQITDRQERETGPGRAIGRRPPEVGPHSKNGMKFTTLFDAGDISGYPSASEADGALLAMLAYWTGADADRMDRLFLQSPLGRRE